MNREGYEVEPRYDEANVASDIDIGSKSQRDQHELSLILNLQNLKEECLEGKHPCTPHRRESGDIGSARI